MEAFEERVEASFGSLGRHSVEKGTQESVRDEMWRLDRSPYFRSPSQPFEVDNSVEEEAAERRRRAFEPSGSESDEDGDGCGDELDDRLGAHDAEPRNDPDYDESIGIRASIPFCSQLDREAERDESDIASLQFDSEPSNVPRNPHGRFGSHPSSQIHGQAMPRSALKGGRQSPGILSNDRRVSFNLPPLPKPYLPPHKRGSHVHPGEETTPMDAPSGVAEPRKETVPDYVTNPDRYVKYEFDEPAVIGSDSGL